VLLEGQGVPGEGFSGGDWCSRDFRPGREVSSVGTIVRDGEGGNRVYCTLATMYVNSAGRRFPNLLLDGEMGKYRLTLCRNRRRQSIRVLVVQQDILEVRHL
jgi:hypothetical protein